MTLVADALAQYYRTHGLPLDGGASDPWFYVHIGSLTLRLPNPPARRRAVVLHDINHLVTGYNTVFSEGEMSIAAFEVGAGCGPFAIVWFINLSMFGLGLLVQPRGVYAAFVRGRRSKSIYRDGRDPSEFGGVPVETVRSLLRVDEAPSRAGARDSVHFAFWATVAVMLWLGPVLLVYLLWRAVA